MIRIKPVLIEFGANDWVGVIEMHTEEFALTSSGLFVFDMENIGMLMNLLRVSIMGSAGVNIYHRVGLIVVSDHIRQKSNDGQLRAHSWTGKDGRSCWVCLRASYEGRIHGWKGGVL